MPLYLIRICFNIDYEPNRSMSDVMSKTPEIVKNRAVCIIRHDCFNSPISHNVNSSSTWWWMPSKKLLQLHVPKFLASYKSLDKFPYCWVNHRQHRFDSTMLCLHRISSSIVSMEYSIKHVPKLKSKQWVAATATAIRTTNIRILKIIQNRS